MNFKNELEELVFSIAKRICDDKVVVEHNKVLQIEFALVPEVVSFSGPPKKEIDLITAELSNNPNVSLLISCKDFKGYKALPAHIQEWGAVVHAMNKYSSGTRYLGIVLSPSSFTKGCEPWATAYNIGLIPPLKGRVISFTYQSTLKIFERVLKGLVKRLNFPYEEMLNPPGFYDFIYRLAADFEGHEEVASHGGRYIIADSNWISSFSELVSTLKGKKIIDIVCTTDSVILKLEGGLFLSFNDNQIIFGDDVNMDAENIVIPVCKKNLIFENCSFDFIKETAINRTITSAADFGSHFEFGLDKEINLGLKKQLLYVISVQDPIAQNVL